MRFVLVRVIGKCLEVIRSSSLVLSHYIGHFESITKHNLKCETLAHNEFFG
jgi:hypothetical protein